MREREGERERERGQETERDRKEGRKQDRQRQTEPAHVTARQLNNSNCSKTLLNKSPPALGGSFAQSSS